MVQVFISYSHADEEYRSELEKHLAILKKQGVISVWHDRRILAGGDLNTEIDSNLLASTLILLMVSSDFLSSEYCYEKEMRTALEMHEKGEARVIPVILRPCDWKNASFGKLKAIPTDGRPVSKFPDVDEAFTEIVQAIRSAVPAEPMASHVAKKTASREPTSGNPRSANLYVRREFTDEAKDRFLSEAFEYMSTFFQNSLEELCTRNPSVTHIFRRIDSNRFTATIYKHGKEVNRCKIWLGGRGGFENGIAYAEGQAAERDGSLNDCLSVENDGSLLYLHTHMWTMGIKAAEKLTFQGGAEYYWARFIECIQR